MVDFLTLRLEAGAAIATLDPVVGTDNEYDYCTYVVRDSFFADNREMVDKLIALIREESRPGQKLKVHGGFPRVGLEYIKKERLATLTMRCLWIG